MELSAQRCSKSHGQAKYFSVGQVNMDQVKWLPQWAESFKCQGEPSQMCRMHDHCILVHLCVCVYIFFLYHNTIYILSYMPHYKIYKYIYIYVIIYIYLYVVVIYCSIEYPNLHLQKLNSVTLP